MAAVRVFRSSAEFPRFVGQEHLASFGRQWNAYEVAHDDEDRATFEAKTGIARASLAGLRVLDAGCGGGRYSKVAGEAGAVVRGVDHTTAVDKAAALCAHLPNAAFAQADLKRLPFEPQSFDVVFSIGVMHHDVDTRAVFDAVARLVRPGGRYAVWLYRKNQWWQERLNDALRAPQRADAAGQARALVPRGGDTGRSSGRQQNAQQDREFQQPSGVGKSPLRHVRLVRARLPASSHRRGTLRLVSGGGVRELTCAAARESRTAVPVELRAQPARRQRGECVGDPGRVTFQRLQANSMLRTFRSGQRSRCNRQRVECARSACFSAAGTFRSG